MPYEPSGHWTSPKTGKKYDPGTPREAYDPEDREAKDAEGQGTWAGDSLDFIGEKMGFVPLTIDENAAGATLNTGPADGQSGRLNDFADTLTQQAATGNGAWRQRFADAVRGTQNAAQSIAQSDPNVDPLSARMNQGYAQQGAQQRAVNEEGMLRAQSQLDARNQMAGMYGQQAQQDLTQSAEAAKVERERRLANQTLLDQSQKNREDTSSSIMGMFGMGSMGSMSDGGRVPGKAKVFGDDERNDTVPAWLSPGEIVIPRSIATKPNADDGAARFVRAVQQGRARKMAEGGYADGDGLRRVTHEEGGGEGVFALNFALPHVGRQVQYDNLRNSVGGGGGGKLNTSQFDMTQARQDALAAMFGQQAAGHGPSVTPYMQQKALDENIAQAVAAQAQGATQADALKTASAVGVSNAADVGRQAAREISAGQKGYADTVLRRRSQDQAMAQAQQRAAWEKTLADAGVSLQNQAQLRNTVSGAGQAAAALGSSGGSGGGGSYQADAGNLASLSNNPFPESGGGSDPGEWDQYPSGAGDFPTGDGDTQYAARGGVIKARKYADGGDVPDYLQPYKWDVFDRKKTLETGVPTYEAIEISAGEPVVTERPKLMHALSQPSAQVVDDKVVVSQKSAPDNRTSLDRYSDAMQKAGYVKDIEPAAAAFSRAVRQLQDYAKHAGAAALPLSSAAAAPMPEAKEAKASTKARRAEREDRDTDFEVQRAHGGAIPGYADGGGVYSPYEPSYLAPVSATVSGFDPYVPDVRRDSGPRTFTGADLGLGGGFSSSATASLPPPSTGTGMPSASPSQQRAARQMGLPVAVDAKPAPAAQSTLMQVGATPEGMPIVEERVGEVIPELKTLKRASNTPTPMPAPAGAPAKPAARGGSGVAPTFDKSLAADEQAAVSAKVTADQAEATAKAEGAAARANAIESAMTQRRMVEEKGRAATDEARRKYDAARDEMARIDTTVDPGRFWATRSTGDKVLGIIGMVLGALGSRDGTNKAAIMLNNAIERDIDAQKAQHAMRMQKGKQNVEAAQTYYSMARSAVQDDLAARDLATAAALDAAAAKAEATVAATGNQQAKSAGLLLGTSLRRAAEAKRQDGFNKAQDRNIEWAKVDATHEAHALAAAAKGGDKDTKKQVAEIEEREKEIQQSGKSLLEMIDRYGTQEKLEPGVEQMMEQAINGMIIASAKMQDREGVVRDADEARERRSMGFEPGFFQRASAAKNAIQSYIDNAERRRANAYSARGMTAP